MEKITAEDLNMDEVTQEVIEHIGQADGSHLVFFDDGEIAILQGGGDWYGDAEKLFDVPVYSSWWGDLHLMIGAWMWTTSKRTNQTMTLSTQLKKV